MTDEHAGQGIPSWDHPVSPDGPRGPALLLFDVNETLSDMSPMSRRFEDVGAPAHLASTWFAGLLRDGFALTVGDACGSFASIAAEAVRVSLHGQPLNRGPEDAVQHILDGFAELTVHADVPDGITRSATPGSGWRRSAPRGSTEAVVLTRGTSALPT
jgi:2-haloacid dehalogenase